MREKVLKRAINERMDFLFKTIKNTEDGSQTEKSMSEEIEILYNEFKALNGDSMGSAVFFGGLDNMTNNVQSIYDLTRLEA